MWRESFFVGNAQIFGIPDVAFGTVTPAIIVIGIIPVNGITRPLVGIRTLAFPPEVEVISGRVTICPSKPAGRVRFRICD